MRRKQEVGFILFRRAVSWGWKEREKETDLRAVVGREGRRECGVSREDRWENVRVKIEEPEAL